MTPVLDPMAVLAATKGNDKNGVIILADKEWLDNSIFKKVRVRHNCGSYDDFILRGGYGYSNCVALDVKNRNQYYEDPDKVFYFSAASTPKASNDKPTSFCSDPLNGCGVTQKTLWFNLYYLIDMATDELAKEINNAPYIRRPSDERYRPIVFRQRVEGRAIPFILDELPSIMVEYLGHPLTEVIKLMQKELQTIYQLIFLLSDHKAGVGNGCFMWYLNQVKQIRNYFYIPHSDAVGSTAGVIFDFPLCDCLGIGNPDDRVYWLGDDNIVYEESFDDAPDYYLFHNIIELFKANKLMPLSFDCRWQYLSIGQHRLSVEKIMQEVLTYGLKTISDEGFIGDTFAKEVCEKGVASVNWKNIFKPDLSSLYNHRDDEQ